MISSQQVGKTQSSACRKWSKQLQKSISRQVSGKQRSMRALALVSTRLRPLRAPERLKTAFFGRRRCARCNVQRPARRRLAAHVRCKTCTSGRAKFSRTRCGAYVHRYMESRSIVLVPPLNGNTAPASPVSYLSDSSAAVASPLLSRVRD